MIWYNSRAARPVCHELRRAPPKSFPPVSARRILLRIGRRVGGLASEAPPRGVESSFRRWMAGSRFAEKTCSFIIGFFSGPLSRGPLNKMMRVT